MSRAPPKWPFQTKKRLTDGCWHEVAIFTCSRCAETEERPITARAGRIHVIATVADAVAAGWIADADSPRAECPHCAQSRRARASGERAPKRPGATVHSLDQSPPEQEIAPVSSTVATASALPKPPLTPREPTQAERLKIRAVLDKHFDDGAGCWLDGFSDQKAGEACAVPWSLVTRIREAAYGPIRVDPEVAALRAEMEQITRGVGALSDRLAAAVMRLDALAKKRAA